MTNAEKIDIILSDLRIWSQNSKSNDSMIYALNNGYKLHAASLWLGTGAASEEVLDAVKGVRIDRKAELEEIGLIQTYASIYVCADCNSYQYLDEDEGPSIVCDNCLKTARKYTPKNKSR